MDAAECSSLSSNPSLCRVGVLSDTHNVFDETLRSVFKNVDCIIHAGDVGHHGGHQDVAARLEEIAQLHAVRGNVDDTASHEELPEYRLLDICGWKLLITHIVGSPPGAVEPRAKQLIDAMHPDIVVFGHSHVQHHSQHGSVLYLNPGSAGPRRFKLPRSVALITLTPKELGTPPGVEIMKLPDKAPPRLSVRQTPKAKSKVTATERDGTASAGPASTKKKKSGSAQAGK